MIMIESLQAPTCMAASLPASTSATKAAGEGCFGSALLPPGLAVAPGCVLPGLACTAGCVLLPGWAGAARNVMFPGLADAARSVLLPFLTGAAGCVLLPVLAGTAGCVLTRLAGAAGCVLTKLTGAAGRFLTGLAGAANCKLNGLVSVAGNVLSGLAGAGAAGCVLLFGRAPLLPDCTPTPTTGCMLLPGVRWGIASLFAVLGAGPGLESGPGFGGWAGPGYKIGLCTLGGGCTSARADCALVAGLAARAD